MRSRARLLLGLAAGVGLPPAAGAQAPNLRTPPPIVEADVQFMQGMIAHHAQAIAMAALVPARTRRSDLRLLAERITVSQEDEIAAMRNWLQARGHHAPEAGHHHGAGLMPGMLSEEELGRLARASDSSFDRLFLEFMIRHHEGALVMVERLFGTRGAGQEPELFGFASDVDADQRAEIRRMRALLAELTARPPVGQEPPEQ